MVLDQGGTWSQQVHQHRQVALPWLARLRWIAVTGQVAATILAVFALAAPLPLPHIALVISATVLSNLVLYIWDRIHEPPDWIIPAVILLDVLLFTVLLYFTGGARNPFSALYAVHVAMAVVVLGSGWAWITVALSAVCYAIVCLRHWPLHLSPAAMQFGTWGALVLVMGLISYFVGRVMRSLRRREVELAEARERASRTEHLASLTTLAAGAAHELGTPLATIALAAKEMELALLQDRDPSLAEDAQLIRHEVDRCRAILDRMRVDVIQDAAGLGGLTGTLGQLIAELRQDLRGDERSRLLVHTSEPAELPLPAARVLRRAVGVLLRNAFDASPEHAQVGLFFDRRDGRIIFRVEDRGPGMAQDVLRRAGEPFFTTKPPGQGMGLGLFLVRLTAETYGGRFELQSSPGAGTSSILQIPYPQDEHLLRSDEPQRSTSRPATARHQPPARGDESPPDPGSGRRRDLPETAGQGAGPSGI
ncbi:MAG TPA: ATP-binding protein [Tepidisphaeraceae bacterium]|nr:ATP-binding protein [Tepidisphaeraceae bacterium]